LGNILGTSFATAGFSYDPNISPNNQSFSAAVRAVALKNATAIVSAGTGTSGGASFSGTYTQPITLATSTDNSDPALTIYGPLHADALDIYNQFGNPAIRIYSGIGATEGIAELIIDRSLGSTANARLEGPSISLTDGVTGYSADIQFSGGQVEIWFGSPSDTQALVLNTATPLIVPNNNGLTVFQVNGTASPSVQAYGANAGALIDLTPDTGSFVGTGTGFTSSQNFSGTWARTGNLVVLTVNGSGSSNTTSFSLSGMPTGIRPSANNQCVPVPYMYNNGGTSGGAVTVQTNGLLVFTAGTFGAAASWTGSGIKGFNGPNTIVYSKQ
jgi:hypothetical protein